MVSSRIADQLGSGRVFHLSRDLVLPAAALSVERCFVPLGSGSTLPTVITKKSFAMFYIAERLGSTRTRERECSGNIASCKTGF